MRKPLRTARPARSDQSRTVLAAPAKFHCAPFFPLWIGALHVLKSRARMSAVVSQITDSARCGGTVPSTTDDRRELFLRSGQQSFALRLLAGELTRPTDGVAPFPDASFRGFLIGSAPLQFSKKAFALQFPFQCPQGLIDVIVSHVNSQFISSAAASLRRYGCYPGLAYPGPATSKKMQPGWALSAPVQSAVSHMCAGPSSAHIGGSYGVDGPLPV